MHAAALSLMAQSHINDLHRAAAVSARRSEARRGTDAARSARRVNPEFVVRTQMFRWLVGRFAV